MLFYRWSIWFLYLRDEKLNSINCWSGSHLSSRNSTLCNSDKYCTDRLA
nr:MAG TPA: hypothetical protein [Caudoviricetes sp.]